MKIHWITLKNYRGFKGIQTLNFNIDAKKDVNIILGTTGAGKTTILDAIHWCLYGHEPDSFKDDEGVAPTITRSELGERKGRSEAYVEVAFGNNSPEYYFKRKVIVWNPNKEELSNKVKRYQKYPEGSISTDPTIVFMNNNLVVNVVFEAFKKTSSGWDILEQPEILVDKILPKEIAFVFLFNGEKLNEFFKEHKNLEQALLDVSQITLTLNTINELKNVKDDYRKKAWKNIPDIENMGKEVKELEKARDGEKQQKKIAEEKVGNIEKEIEDIDQYLKNTNIEIVKRQADDRVALLSEEKGLKNSIRTGKLERNKLLTVIMPWAYLINEVNYSLSRIKEIAKTAGLPPNIKDKFLNDLLEQGKCICKRSVANDSDPEIIKARKCVEELLENVATPSRITEQCNDGLYKLDAMKVSIKEKKQAIDKICEEIRINEDTKNKNDAKLESISKSLGKLKKDGITPDTVIDRVNSYEAARVKYGQNKDLLIKDIGGHDTEIDRLEKCIIKKNNEIDKAATKQSSNLEDQRKARFCIDSLNLLETIKDELMLEMTKNIESGTTKHFLSLIWKFADIGGEVTPNIQKVQINENYSISVLNKHGENWVKSLSQGETQTLAYSFIAALKESSNTDFSMVIDTPLGRLSKKPRELFAQLITTFLKGTQFIFLMTDTEYTPTIQNIFDSGTASKHILKHNEEEGITTAETLR